jgi:serine/threonine protein kinase
MGVVYKAKHPFQEKTVALKVIHAGAFASEHAKARLRTEAEAISRLKHSGIVGILEVGEHQGLPYLAMEYVEGGSLDRFLGGQPTPPTLAANFVRHLALAVQHTHDQKIIHRDLKPANILLEGCKPFESTSSEVHQAATVEAAHPLSHRPRITDFGLAKLLDGDSTAWTVAGAVLGTANYMSPEQAGGEVAEIGPASDIYALGVILYELLCGRPPIQGATFSETVLKVIHDPPPTFVQQGVSVPIDLEAVCLKCLEKSPELRYASAAELAEELERFSLGCPVLASVVSDRERLIRRAAREGFSIQEEIGRGPRSTVFRATFGPLQQTVALKVFDQGVCGEAQWNERVQSVSQTSAALHHPQVAQPRQAGWWDGFAFVVNDFSQQGTLASAMKQQRFSIRSSLELVEQLAEAVCYLHRQGVAHGNLKPSNILIAADGIPRLIDFRPMSGLAFGAFDSNHWDADGLAYLAPEFVSDAQANALPVTDNYGLAAILYGLVGGKPPFTAETPEALLEQIRTKPPELISKLNPEVPKEIEILCKTCLRKKPFWRMARAFDVLSTVRQCLKRLDGPRGR